MPKQSVGYSLPKAPKYQELPAAKPRAARGAPELVELRVQLEVVTPILGGSHQNRAIDDVDVIRAPSVRGHLRFWWRALYAAQYANADALFQRESALWGRAAADKDDGGRSAVEIRVSVECAGSTDSSEIRLFSSRDQQATPGAYALWPARAETKQNAPTAPRRQPGTQFQVTLKVPAAHEAEVRNALRAWILFGGYGGRTRRGLGSLRVLEDARSWLPSAGTREALTSLFGRNVFEAPTSTPRDVPLLGGAAIHVGTKGADAQRAWTTALDWLKDFRQGFGGSVGERAREPGPNGSTQRPSISNWPEADKIRRLRTPQQGIRWAHTPRHNATAAWPRAALGLPIIGQFQTKGRNNERYDEPSAFELRWRAGNGEHDRLASPLIVKALPLADGTFAPCALWLNRSLPNDAQAGLARPKRGRPNEKEVDPKTVAPFDRLVADGDTALFSALANKTSLRQAFLDWLHSKHQTTVVAP